MQKCSSGHIEATQPDVIDIIRQKIITGTTIVTMKKGEKKVAEISASGFQIKSANFGANLDANFVAETVADIFNIDDDEEVVGEFQITKEDVKIQVNNKVFIF